VAGVKNTKTQAARSGRWSLTKRGTGALLRYRPPKSDEELTFELNREQLAKARKAASKANAGEVRDIILTPDVRAQALVASGVSSEFLPYQTDLQYIQKFWGDLILSCLYQYLQPLFDLRYKILKILYAMFLD
jgi:hypothetical protein